MEETLEKEYRKKTIRLNGILAAYNRMSCGGCSGKLVLRGKIDSLREELNEIAKQIPSNTKPGGNYKSSING